MTTWLNNSSHLRSKCFLRKSYLNRALWLCRSDVRKGCAFSEGENFLRATPTLSLRLRRMGFFRPHCFRASLTWRA